MQAIAKDKDLMEKIKGIKALGIKPVNPDKENAELEEFSKKPDSILESIYGSHELPTVNHIHVKLNGTDELRFVTRLGFESGRRGSVITMTTLLHNEDGLLILPDPDEEVNFIDVEIRTEGCKPYRLRFFVASSPAHILGDFSNLKLTDPLAVEISWEFKDMKLSYIKEEENTDDS